MELTVMTSNVRGPADPGPAAWEARRGLLARVLREADPDLIGTQETTGSQRADLLERMPEHRWLGRDHFGGSDGEHTGILWRPDRVELAEHGDFWLSAIPDVAGSPTWGVDTSRVVTWARFVRDGIRFLVANTHFPWPETPEAEAGRTRCAEVLREQVLALAGDEPAVVMADFNTVPSSGAHRVLSGDFPDAADAGRDGPAGTFHGFRGTPTPGDIDWILARGFTSHGIRVLTEHDGDVYPSDHFPVVARLTA